MRKTALKHPGILRPRREVVPRHSPGAVVCWLPGGGACVALVWCVLAALAWGASGPLMPSLPRGGTAAGPTRSPARGRARRARVLPLRAHRVSASPRQPLARPPAPRTLSAHGDCRGCCAPGS